ncbi:MAG: tetratricopeptide repeat protein [Tenuifilaceae bacterium]|jgi:tetratricopeptide (TPR) repeat protein|nr:tetratricopeptide repeat protein [Tenuifilaceae bacterium]
MHRIITLLCCISVAVSCSEKEKTQKAILETNINAANKERSKVETLIKQFDDSLATNSSQAYHYLQLASHIATSNDLRELQVEILNKEASILEKESRYTEAINKYHASLDLSKTLENNKKEAFIHIKLSRLYRVVANYNDAMTHAISALELYGSEKDSTGIPHAYTNIGNVYRYLKDYNRAIDYYFKALGDGERFLEKRDIASIYNNIGICFKQKKEYDLALNYYEKSYKIYSSINDLAGTASYYNNSASIYLLQGKNNMAIVNINKALQLRKVIGDKRNEANSFISLGRYYTITKEYDKAIEYFQKGLNIVTKLGLPDKQQDYYKRLSEVYDSMNQPSKALAYYKQYVVTRDSVLDHHKSIEISRLELKYSIEKQNYLKSTQKEKRDLQIIIYSLTFILLLLVLFIILLYMRKRLMTQKVENIMLIKDNKRIKEDLQSKNREIATYSLSAIQKNSVVTTIVERIKNYIPKMSNEGKGKLYDLIKEIEAESNANIWDEFEIRFLQVHPSFYDNITKTFPDLSQNERRLCALLKLDLSTKEISAITGQNPHAINVARTRLRKKLDLVKDTRNLSDFLSHF